MSKPPQARSLVTIQKVLDAADTLVARQGIGSLTLEAVAAEAGVSKGGLMHHFRSKDALVEALVVRKLDLLKAGLDLHRDESAEVGARTLRAMARYGRLQYADEQGFSRALLVAAVENSRSLGQFKAMFAKTMDEVTREAGGRDLDTLLLFAVVGLLLTKSLGIGELSLKRAQEVFSTVQRFAASEGADICP